MSATSHPPATQPIPVSAGIGLRARHHEEIATGRPRIAWVEAHSENYFGAGGFARAALLRVRERHPLSLHGVGLSLGSTDPLDLEHLGELARLIRDVEPALVSEHISWSSVGGVCANDLLPLPWTEEALRHLAARVREVQERLGRQILLENPSTYLEWADAEMSEWAFVSGLIAETGCALLLDVNNVYVSATNHGWSALEYLRGIPAHAVGEIHLAGHSIQRLGQREIRIDTHGSRVCDAVWSLYAAALELIGPVPTLIEWDTDVPELPVLLDEASRAQRLLEATHALAA